MAPIAVDRRAALIGTTGLLFTGLARAEDAIAALERGGVRIGLAALDTGSGKVLRHRADERFLMCSTFKLSLAAAILAQVEKGRERLERVIRYDKEQVLDYAPVTSRHVGAGMTVRDLCIAAITLSDNTAGNLLLAGLGGPAAMTAFWRALGDGTTRLDRVEPQLNLPDGLQDTTAPAVMLMDMNRMLLGDVLSEKSRRVLHDWLAMSTTGAAMLKKGMPSNWHVADKTGRNTNGCINDLALIRPPGRKPILVAAFTEKGGDDLLQALGRLVTDAFA
jgi:beta-lactamase class A